MKKRHIITLALCAMLAVGSVGTLTACGNSGTSVTEADTVSLYKYVSTIQTNMADQMETNEYSAKIYPLGNETIYMDFTLKVQLTSGQMAQAKPALEKEMDAMNGQAQEMLDEMRVQVGLKGPRVNLRYLNADGSIIAEKTFQ